MPIHLQTPLVESDVLGTSAQRVWLKVEALQPCGSFKLRGIGHACEQYVARGARRLLSSSGGNAGLAVAYAGRRLGVPVVVVVPSTTGEWAKALIRRQGAEVLVHGKSWQEANEHLLTMQGATDAAVHPFDDPLLWQGHSSMILEAANQGPRPEAVVLSVGGGGLLCGVLEGMYAVGWQEVPVVAVETVGAESLHAAVAAQRLVRLEAITSVATSLGARQVCQRAFEWTQQHEVIATTVSDAEAIQACLEFADEHRMIVEPACGATLAAVAQRRVPALQRASEVLAIVCGGVGTRIGELQALAARSRS